jgi:hypothetical protein
VKGVQKLSLSGNLVAKSWSAGEFLCLSIGAVRERTRWETSLLEAVTRRLVQTQLPADNCRLFRFMEFVVTYT